MKKNLKWVLFGLILLISILVIGIKISTLNHSNQKEIEEDVIFKEEDSKKEIVEPEKESNKVFVDIKGAIVNPGVYEIEENKKVMDVISLAGGFLDEANTTTINLAKKVKNEMVIIVYTNEEIKKLEQSAQTVKKVDNTCLCPQIKNDACLNTEEKKTTTSEEDTKNTLQEIININTATAADFDKLPGIGASKAETIVQYREKNGNFNQIEDLKEVPGIGEALFEKIKDYITV